MKKMKIGKYSIHCLSFHFHQSTLIDSFFTASEKTVSFPDIEYQVTKLLYVTSPNYSHF